MALTDSLISYWMMDEASGTRIDSHGSNDLTDNNTVGSATGKINSAADFEASSSEKLTLADNADVSFGDEDFTLAFWINRESELNVPIIGKWDWGVDTQNDYMVWMNSGEFQWIVRNTLGGTVAVNSTIGGIPTATWFFVVVWHDSANNQIGISVNAGTPQTAANSDGVTDGTHDFEIGGSNSTYYDGLIDEVGLWGRLLTSDERTELYNSGNGLAYSAFSPSTAKGSISRLRRRNHRRP